jgi:uncharacterized protein
VRYPTGLINFRCPFFSNDYNKTNKPSSMQSTTLTRPRIEMIDALRGFALFGIIIAHFGGQFFAGFPPPGHNIPVKNNVDEVLDILSGILVFGKFFTIFSFLFGLSFGIQLLGAKEKNKPFIARFAWRVLILLLIGFLHHLHFRGDILVIYGVLGFFLLLFVNTSNRWLLIWAIFFIVNGPTHILNIINLITATGSTATVPSGPPPQIIKMSMQATIFYDHAKQGDYLWIIKDNLTNGLSSKLQFQLLSGRLFVTLGLFILGFYMARKGIFKDIGLYKKSIKKWFWIGLGVSVIVVGCALLLGLQQFMGSPTTIKDLIGSVIIGLFDPALSLVYVAGFVLLYNRSAWQKRLSHLAPMGRMGLTTYLVQSVFGLFIFFGYGLNLLDVYGSTVAFALATAVFIAQIFMGKWWMKRFYYGPFEWFWRSATYFQWQPFRRKKNDPVGTLVSPASA